MKSLRSYVPYFPKHSLQSVRLGNTTLLGEGAQNHPHDSHAAWNNQLWSLAAAVSKTTFKNLKIIRNFSNNWYSWASAVEAVSGLQRDALSWAGWH